MKKQSILILTAVSAIMALAAGPLDAQPLDSLEYVFPEFTNGVVCYNDRSVSQGLLNICLLDQMVKCISPEGEVLDVQANDAILSVTAGGRTFVRMKELIVEMVETNGDTGVGIARKTSVIDNTREGAYGMNDNTSSIVASSYSHDSGRYTKLVLDDRSNVSYKVLPFISKAGRLYVPTKKTFQKLFPDNKAFIEDRFAAEKPDFSDAGAVLAFYHLLLKK